MKELATHWTLDPEITFLNHGSFGACPRPVLRAQSELRSEMEREPLLFLGREFNDRVDAARAELAEFIGADPSQMAFVTNATTGVNTVLRSLEFSDGDEILVTNQGYAACTNAADFVVTATHGTKLVSVPVPFPLASPDQILEPILAGVSDRTKLAIIDHITSPTGIILPIERIVAALQDRGVDVLVDGAHAPGMVPLDVTKLGAAYYTGNCHKWICSPKGAAFLHVRADRMEGIRPLVISHGAKIPRGSRSFFHAEADWTGTHDPTAWLSVPAAIRFGRDLMPNGWADIRKHNKELVLAGRRLICDALGIPEPAPESMIGSLASVPLPNGEADALQPPLLLDPLHQRLFDEYRIEVPVMPWPAPPQRVIRISAQAYNSIDEYERLVKALRETL